MLVGGRAGASKGLIVFSRTVSAMGSLRQIIGGGKLGPLLVATTGESRVRRAVGTGFSTGCSKRRGSSCGIVVAASILTRNIGLRETGIVLGCSAP